MKKLIPRIVISLGLLIFVLSRIDLRAVGKLIVNINPIIYMGVICLVFIHQYIWAHIWKFALEQKAYKVKSHHIYSSILTSNFFGMFLPSVIGPDLVLTYYVGRSLPEKEHAPSSLLFIRLINVSAYLLISGVVLIWLASTIVLRQILILTWILLLSVWIFYWMAIHPQSKKLIYRLLGKRTKWLGFIYKIFHSFSEYDLKSIQLFKLGLLCVALTFLKVSIDYLVSVALGLNIPYIWFLGLIPAISIITLLPISIAGLGVREGAYIGILSNMGIPAASSLSISLLVFTLNILLCLAGGVLYLIRGTHIKYKKVTIQPQRHQGTKE